MRRRLFEIIEVAQDDDRVSAIYDTVMFIAIVISIIPLAFKSTNRYFLISDAITAVLFILDYVFRLITADYKLNSSGPLAFVKYPFTPMAIIDLISILPALTILNNGYKLLRLLRVARTLRTFRILKVFRVFKALRYSKSMGVIVKVIRNSKDALLAVCTLAAGYILISALVIFNVEGDSFKSFFDAIYWATVSLTTVGYGDIYPITTAGRVITMISSVFGIAIVALPAGIITAGYMEALKEEDPNDLPPQ